MTEERAAYLTTTDNTTDNTMKTPSLEKLNATYALAQSKLDAALAAGADASEARQALESATQALETAQDADDEHANEVLTKRTEQARQACADHAALLDADFAQIIASITAPKATKPDSLWAQKLLSATETRDAAEAALNALSARLASLDARLAEITASRSAVVVRRAEGDHREEDGQLLALADADIEGLTGLIKRVRPEQVKVQAAMDQAVKELATVDVRWNNSKRKVEGQGLVEVAIRLEAALVAVAQRIHALSREPGGFVPWNGANIAAYVPRR